MKRLEETLYEPSIYSGELYLELHRGILTNQHVIKRNNRMAEWVLRTLEYLTFRSAVKNGTQASSKENHPLTEELLINQFHDILPGTCIPRAHKEAIEAVFTVIEMAEKYRWECMEQLKSKGEGKEVSVLNTLSFEYEDVIYLPYEGLHVVGDFRQQIIENLEGVPKLAVAGVKIPAFGSKVLSLTDHRPDDRSAFREKDSRLETPYFSKKRDISHPYLIKQQTENCVEKALL